MNLFVFIHCLQNAKYVWNKADFDAVNPANTDFLMGKKNCCVVQGQQGLTCRAKSKNNSLSLWIQYYTDIQYYILTVYHVVFMRCKPHHSCVNYH